MIHCLIAIFKNIKGYHENRSYWYDEEIPFVEAAEIGTEKVIRDHSTIGIVVTTDGSIGEIERKDYIEAENQVINELKEIGKPFIVVLNSVHPTHPDTEKLAEELRNEHNVPVIPVSAENMSEKEIYNILKEALFEFPVLSVNVNMPDWIACLSYKHPLKKEYIEKIKESVTEVDKVRDVDMIIGHFKGCDHISKAYLSEVNAATGEITINLEAPEGLYNDVLNEIIGTNIDSKAKLISLFQEFNETKEEYDQFKEALKMVKQTGYGTSFPTIKDMKLDTPEIIKQGTRYGVKLKAVAPSIHMIRVDVESTFEELIDNLMKNYESDPDSVWKSEMFGRSLDVIVQEGIRGKLSLMPDNIRHKLQTTLTKVVNKGSNNMIAIVI